MRALSQLLELSCDYKNIQLKQSVGWLPSCVHTTLWQKRIVPHLLRDDSDKLDGELPKLVVSCGRRGGLAAMSLRAQHPEQPCQFVHIQDPQVSAAHFDLVIAMGHDKIRGENVIFSDYALHAITPEVLAQARVQFAPQFAGFEAPLISVLLGGATNKYHFGAQAMRLLILQLQAILDTQAGSLLITPSRRTGAANIAMLKQAFAGNARVYIYDENAHGQNPYMGLLAVADYIVVTNDSVNMMSEALATGKPVVMLPLIGHRNTKPARFAAQLLEQGIMREYKGALTPWDYAMPAHMAEIKHKVELLLANARW